METRQLKTIKGEIALLDKDFDNTTCKYYWRSTIFFEKEPNLKLGECEIKQKIK